MSRDFADKLFAAERALAIAHNDFENAALRILGCTAWPFEDYHFDSYDASFELDDCDPDLRLTPEQRMAFWELGFLCCWLNYTDGTERHYWSNCCCPEGQGRLKRKVDSVYLESEVIA